MEAKRELKFESPSFYKRLKGMLGVDFYRLFHTPMFYIFLAIAAIIPAMVSAMTMMPDQNGSTMEPLYSNVWQIIAAAEPLYVINSISDYANMNMVFIFGGIMVSVFIGHDYKSGYVKQLFTTHAKKQDYMMSKSIVCAFAMACMCNINLLYFFVAALVCIFTADDFRSGYAKNLFTVRAKKADYVISRTLVCFVGGALMILAFFIGAMIGGAVSGLSFDAGAAGAGGIIMCLLAKIFLIAVFVSLYLLWSVAAKQKLWLSLVGSLCTGMFLFMMIPMLTPLDSTVINVALCLAGGVLFGAGFGAISNRVLEKTSLV